MKKSSCECLLCKPQSYNCFCFRLTIAAFSASWHLTAVTVDSRLALFSYILLVNKETMSGSSEKETKEARSEDKSTQTSNSPALEAAAAPAPARGT